MRDPKVDPQPGDVIESNRGRLAVQHRERGMVCVHGWSGPVPEWIWLGMWMRAALRGGRVVSRGA